jgi:hypothetical protein
LTVFQFYFQKWTTPLIALAFFFAFGHHVGGATYWRCVCAVGKHTGCTPFATKNEDLGEMRFGMRQVATAELCAPIFSCSPPTFLTGSHRSRPSFVASVSIPGQPDVETGSVLYGSIVSQRDLTCCTSLDLQGRISSEQELGIGEVKEVHTYLHDLDEFVPPTSEPGP